MELIVYPRLSTQSKRSMLKIGGRFGAYRIYIPRARLLDRLERETGMTRQQLIDQVQKERSFLLQGKF